jgi:DNA polymerase-1
LVDTMIAAWLVNENHGDGQYKLGPCIERELDWTYDKSLGKKGVQNFSFEDAARYARLDAFGDWLLWKRLLAKLKREKQDHIFYDIEQPVLDVVIDMELAGAPIDVAAMERLEESLRGRLAEVQADIEEFNGGPIQLTNPGQLRELVYGKRGRKVTILTDKEKLPSTSAKALGLHAFKDPNAEEDAKWDPANIKDKCVAAILEHAATHKVYSTYVANNLPVVQATGKLHAEFDQIGTVTGRFSSRRPNLQNIPIRKGKEIRDLFIAGEGYKLIVSDYSQVELRILAHFTQDPLLMRAYIEGDVDLHSATARRAYGIPEGKEPTTMQRSLAKNTNFSMVYGATAWTLVQRYNVPEDVAEKLVEAFFATYKKVAPWQRAVLKECRSRARTKKRHGVHVDPYVTTLLGRRRRLPEIMLPDSGSQVPGKKEGVTYGKLRRGAERQAINTVIQGTAADVMKLAMIELHRRKVEEGLPVELLMVVHDAMLEEVNGAMESVNMLSVPLVAEGKICDRWSEAK